MTNEDIKKDDLQNDEDIDMKDENLDVNDEAEVDASDDEKYQDLMDKFMRLQADFSNYKRRTEAQKSEYVELGVKKIANDLLPVIDNFERALDHHAVLTEDSDEYDSGYVIEVLQKGYLINDKTLRPAMVNVSQ